MQYIAFQRATDKQTMAALLTEAIAAYRARYGRECRELLVSEGDKGIAFAGIVTVTTLVRKDMIGLVI